MKFEDELKSIIDNKKEISYGEIDKDVERICEGIKEDILSRTKNGDYTVKRGLFSKVFIYDHIRAAGFYSVYQNVDTGKGITNKHVNYFWNKLRTQCKEDNITLHYDAGSECNLIFYSYKITK